MEKRDTSLVSVIVPVYKVEKFLPACMGSLLHQTYENLDIILVDDGSPDACGEMCDKYALEDPRIRVIHKPNGGLSDARNAGLQVANGDYILFVDSDDLLAADHIRRLVELAGQEQADIVACDFEEIEEDAVSLSDPGTAVSVPVVLTQEEGVKAWLYRRHYGVSAWAKLYSRECVQGILFPVGKLHEDVGTTYKMFLRARKVVYTNEKLYGYRQRTGSIVNSSFNPRRMDYLVFTREIMDLMKAEYPQYYRAAVSRHFQGCIQIACAQKTPDQELLQEIRRYGSIVVRDRECRGIYRLLAAVGAVSPRTAVAMAALKGK